MNKKAKKATVAATGIVALTLLSALSHADSLKYSDTTAINTSIDEAASVALQSVGGTLIEAELEMDDDRAIWEIEIVNDAKQVVSVEVDGLTGEIVHTETSDDVAPSMSQVVSLEQAIELVRAADDGALIEVELEEEDDKLIWEIETMAEDSQESTFRIDGTTGIML